MANSRYDIVIVGSGAGGGTIAHALASSDASVLIVERGDFIPQEPQNWDPEAVWKDLRYRTTERWIDAGGHEFRPYTHYCVGGNTKFWGSVMYRLRQEDFRRGRALRRSLSGLAYRLRNAQPLLRPRGAVVRSARRERYRPDRATAGAVSVSEDPTLGTDLADGGRTLLAGAPSLATTPGTTESGRARWVHSL